MYKKFFLKFPYKYFYPTVGISSCLTCFYFQTGADWSTQVMNSSKERKQLIPTVICIT